MAVRLRRVLSVLTVLPLVLAVALAAPRAARNDGARGTGAGADAVSTNATYYNAANVPGADPHVLYDEDSGYYYAYSTTGADPGYRFGIYRSPDLVTWEHIPGGALEAGAGAGWGHDWFWAPEVHHNTETGLYYLFYAARMNEDVTEHFHHPNFEEPCKIGVAVAESPRGPFRNITGEPLDYHPYDPDYHDVNRLMGPEQRKPPETLAEGRTAPLGTYIPMIDPDVFFDNGRIYLYFSRNAYRNWVWDRDLDKYIETSDIYAVELTTRWWHDPTGRTMPTIRPRYLDANEGPDDPPGVRKDGFTPILDYRSDKQAWENAHVDDYAESGGTKKDRRWEEGSTTIKRYRVEDGRRVPVYYLLYSANHYKSRNYGVGYAVSDSPLGPWRKSGDNPVLKQDESKDMYSTGHGSVVSAPDGSELYYVHHGRPSTTTHRRLYTERMRFLPEEPDVGGSPSLDIEQSVGDEPVPAGVAPYSLTAGTQLVDVSGRRPDELHWSVTSAAGAAMDLSNPLNRVEVSLDPASPVTAAVHDDRATLTGEQEGVSALKLQYQRQKSGGAYFDIDNTTTAGTGRQSHEPVSATVAVAGCTATVTGSHTRPLRVSEGVVCLRDAVVSGPVRVDPDASLVAVRSAITGPVEALRPDTVWISGGTVSGPVRVRGAAGIVRLDGTTVSGRVSVTGSSGDVTFLRSVLHGAVSLHDNAGTRVPVVAGNTIAGSLACTGNVPEPAADRAPNTVRGAASGQCGKLAAQRVP